MERSDQHPDRPMGTGQVVPDEFTRADLTRLLERLAIRDVSRLSEAA